jgi:hypothetical protein
VCASHCEVGCVCCVPPHNVIYVAAADRGLVRARRFLVTAVASCQLWRKPTCPIEFEIFAGACEKRPKRFTYM